MSTVLGDLLKSSLRRAGITQLPGITPNVDQYGELIPELNRLLSSYNLDGHKIFSTSIDRYAMSPNQTSYFLGPTGDWVAPRPNFIVTARVILTGTSPEIAHQVRVIRDDKEWGSITIQELLGAWPWAIYNEEQVPDTKIHLYPYPSAAGNDLELYTWQALKTDFSAVSDVVILPDGYEHMITTNLALQAVALNPGDSKLSGMQLALLEKQAANALDAVIIMNHQNVPLRSNDFTEQSSGMTREEFYRGPYA